MLRGLAAIALVATTLALAPIDLAGAAPVTLDGTVFRDHDQNGARDVATEPGVAGIEVRAVEQNGATASTTSSGSDGTYSISLDGANEYRVEFSIPAPLDFLEPGPLGTDSGGDVRFVRSGDSFSGIDFGVANPSDYCQSNPTLATPCYAFGDAGGVVSGNANEPALVLFDYDDPGLDLGPHAEVAFGDIGTTFGVADDPDGGFFVGTYIKRHAGILDTPGTIYQVSSDGSSVSVFATVDAGVDPHPATTVANDWLRDSGSWDAVGKVGLGDLDVSDDGSTLFAMNLFDRSVYPIALPAGTVGTPVAAPAAPDCTADDSRPFALSANDGRLYTGVVCSLQSGGGGDVLAAYVFSADQADLAGGWTLEVTIPLDGQNYPRKCADSFGDGATPPGSGNGSSASNDNDPENVCDASTPNELNANWREWLPVGPPTNFTDGPSGINGDGTVINDPRWSSAMLTDIEFDSNGDMILGLRSRFGDQTGNGTMVPDPDGPTAADIRGVGLGQILKACDDPGPLNVIDTVPSSITPLAASGEGWTCAIDGQIVTCVSDGELAAGASLAPISITTTAPAAGATVTNDAVVESSVLEATTLNNEALAAVTTPVPPPSTTLGPITLPRTGADALRWSTVGALLVLLGAALTASGGGRRRRPDAF